MSNDLLEEKIRGRGYFNFKTLKNLPLVCEIKDDKSIVIVESRAHKIIDAGPNQGQVFATNSVATYTGRGVGEGAPLNKEQDLEFDTVQRGELVCKMENGITVTPIPMIVQVNRPGVRNSNGEEQYDMVNVAKMKVGGKQQ